MPCYSGWDMIAAPSKLRAVLFPILLLHVLKALEGTHHISPILVLINLDSLVGLSLHELQMHRHDWHSLLYVLLATDADGSVEYLRGEFF